MLDLQRPIPVIRLFRHFQCTHGASDSGSRSTDGIPLSVYGTDRRWWVHASVVLPDEVMREADANDTPGGCLSSGVTGSTNLFLSSGV